MTRRRIPIRRSLNRENLIAGCERELLLMCGLLAFALVVIGQTVSTAIFGSVLWIVSLFVLRKMAKRDPLLSRIYLRHTRYRTFYPAKGRPQC